MRIYCPVKLIDTWLVGCFSFALDVISVRILDAWDLTCYKMGGIFANRYIIGDLNGLRRMVVLSLKEAGLLIFEQTHIGYSPFQKSWKQTMQHLCYGELDQTIQFRQCKTNRLPQRRYHHLQPSSAKWLRARQEGMHNRLTISTTLTNQ